MEIFLPSLLLILLAYLVSTMLIPRLSPVVLMGGIIFLLGFSIYNHYSLFSNEYSVMTWLDMAKSFAPSLMVTLVIVLMLGYLIYAYTTGSLGSLPMLSTNIPPPDTATNSVTEAIGNGLVNVGAANVKNVNGRNNISQTALSQGV
jgi:hypothetical protein